MHKPKILVISGRKQAGKSTVSNFVQGVVALQQGLISEFEVSERTDGELFIKTEKAKPDLGFPFVKKYEYADQLKIIMKNFFLLTDDQLNGPNGHKDTLTRYLWENMPGLSETEFAGRTGHMKAREITQYMGTEVFRKIYDRIHIEATYNKIKEDGVGIATINGGRFPNEIEFRPDYPADVKTLRLARTMYPDDQHSSETSLDHRVFNWTGFDAVVWNQTMSIEETCGSVLSWLKVWGWVL